MVLGALALLLLVTVVPASGIIVGTATVEGWVTGPDDAPVEDALVEVVGMEEYNTTTDTEGHYVMEVPYLASGQSMSFTHSGLQRREVSTGPLVEDGLVLLNVTLQEKPPWATLVIQILPRYGTSGSNYGLRQDVMTVESMPGTPDFEWDDTVSEGQVSVPAPGAYLVTGTRPGYYAVSLEVAVARGDRLSVDLDLTDHKKPTYGWVNGTVTHDGFSLPFVTVVAVPEEGTRDYQAVTGTDGNFSMQLPFGNYTVRVEAEGYARLSEGVVVELDRPVDLSFPVSVAQDTGDAGDPVWFWAVIIASVAVLGSVIAYATLVRRRTVAAEAVRAAERDELRCPACDAVAFPDADACTSCGAAFPWRSFRCPDCGAVMGLDEKRCPECGNQTFDLHRG